MWLIFKPCWLLLLIASVSVNTKHVAIIPVFVIGIKAVFVIHTGDGLYVTDCVYIRVCVFVCYERARWRNTLCLTGGVPSLTIWNHDLQISSRDTPFICFSGTIWWSTQKLLIERNTLRIQYTVSERLGSCVIFPKKCFGTWVCSRCQVKEWKLMFPFIGHSWVANA